jgi:hypothetical protein
MMRIFLTVIFLAAFTSVAMAELPTGYWPVEKTQPILDRTMRLTLDPDLSQLSEAESRAVDELLAAGAVIHELYEKQRHAQAQDAKLALVELHQKSGKTVATQNLLDLFHLSKGPIATTLDNERQAKYSVCAAWCVAQARKTSLLTSPGSMYFPKLMLCISVCALGLRALVMTPVPSTPCLTLSHMPQN